MLQNIGLTKVLNTINTKIITLADEYKARAMHNRCRCPPEIDNPRSPISVKSPLGIKSISAFKAQLSIIFS